MAERTMIQSMLPSLRDWYIQAGNGRDIGLGTLFGNIANDSHYGIQLERRIAA